MVAPHYWVLPPVASAPGVALPLAQVSALLHRLGRPGRHAVAEELLRLVGTLVPLAQCTIFAYQGQGRPRIVAVGDRSRTQALPRISQDYVSRFYPLDGSVRVMQAELAAAQRASASQPRILLHRQRGEDVSHPDYRAICYELPQVAERLAILALYAGRRWLSVNFYRGLEHGPFDDAAIATLEALAPLVVDVVRLHYAGQAVQHDLGELMLDRLQRRCPALTARDLDVLRALLAGQPTDQLAQQLGLTLSSAQTYLKRVYRKLGIAGQRELLGLLTEPEADPGSATAAG